MTSFSQLISIRTMHIRDQFPRRKARKSKRLLADQFETDLAENCFGPKPEKSKSVSDFCHHKYLSKLGGRWHICTEVPRERPERKAT